MFRLNWILVLAAPLFGGETAVLTSGMTVHIDRHEESNGPGGAIVRLYRGQTVTEMPRTVVTAFEADEVIPQPPPPAADATQPQVPAPVPLPVVSKTPDSSGKAIDARELVRAAALRAGLPAAFVESVAKTESGFDTAAVSPKGALGVMQLMPATAKALGADASDPEQNIEAGARLLRELLIKYNGDVVKALAAYNAGEGAVDHYQGVPPFPET